MLTSKEIKSDIKIIFQKVKDLHKACPKNLGDWYFTGDYPTPGGNRVVNTAFINFMKEMTQELIDLLQFNDYFGKTSNFNIFKNSYTLVLPKISRLSFMVDLGQKGWA